MHWQDAKSPKEFITFRSLEWSRRLVRNDRTLPQFPKDEHFAQSRVNDPDKGRNYRSSEEIGLHATSSDA